MVCPGIRCLYNDVTHAGSNHVQQPRSRSVKQSACVADHPRCIKADLFDHDTAKAMADEYDGSNMILRKLISISPAVNRLVMSCMAYSVLLQIVQISQEFKSKIAILGLA